MYELMNRDKVVATFEERLEYMFGKDLIRDGQTTKE